MAGTTEERPTYKDVLRYIYDSEECKIDSLQGKQLKQIVERLCLNDDNSNSEFLYLFQTVETDIYKIKGQSKCSLFQAMYKYSAETFSDYYEKLEPTTEYRNIVLWQMIIEILFLGPHTKPSNAMYPGSAQVSSNREFSVVEENAIYYAAGYVVRKVMKKYRETDDDMGAALVSTLHGMIGENASSIECTASYLDYVKMWTKQNDRGGLIHVSNDTFRFFCAIEKVTFELIKNGSTKENIVGQVMGNESVIFSYEIIAHELKESWSNQLLREIVTQWFIIRGFSYSSMLLEKYKTGCKKNIKGSKGLRKELH